MNLPTHWNSRICLRQNFLFRFCSIFFAKVWKIFCSNSEHLVLETFVSLSQRNFSYFSFVIIKDFSFNKQKKNDEKFETCSKYVRFLMFQIDFLLVNVVLVHKSAIYNSITELIEQCRSLKYQKLLWTYEFPFQLHWALFFFFKSCQPPP